MAAIALTTIFGNEITVHRQPRHVDRQYSGYTGAHGITGMLIGTHGYQLIVKGRYASTGMSYAYARAAVENWVADIEDNYLLADAGDYSFMNQTFYNVVWDRLQLLPDAGGKVYRLTAERYVIVDFIAYGRGLI